jgi:uncharacterized tellurite resistance protein B-like protein
MGKSEDLIRSVVTILAAEGRIDKSELRFLEALRQHLGLGEDVVKTALEDAKKGKRSLHIPREPEEGRRMLKVMIKAAAANREIAPQELKILQLIADKTGVSREDLQANIQRALEKQSQIDEAQRYAKRREGGASDEQVKELLAGLTDVDALITRVNSSEADHDEAVQLIDVVERIAKVGRPAGSRAEAQVAAVLGPALLALGFEEGMQVMKEALAHNAGDMASAPVKALAVKYERTSVVASIRHYESHRAQLGLTREDLSRIAQAARASLQYCPPGERRGATCPQGRRG